MSWLKAKAKKQTNKKFTKTCCVRYFKPELLKQQENPCYLSKSHSLSFKIILSVSNTAPLFNLEIVGMLLIA